MARLIGILVAIASLAACSSGVSNTGAGAATGTDCKSNDLNLICTMTITMDSTDVDAYASDTNGDGFPDELLTNTNGTLDITVVDPLGTFAHIFQGITWQTYDVSYATGQPRGPVLGQRRYTRTLSITLTNNTGQGTVVIPIVDLVTKKQFTNQANATKIYPYVVTVRATGTDFATGHHVVVVARITIHMGDFTQNVPTPPVPTTPTGGGGTSASLINYRAGLLNVAEADADASNVRWQ